MRAKAFDPIVISDLRGGRNDTDPPMSLPLTQATEFLNCDWKDTTFAHKRGGASAVAESGGTAFGSGIQTLVRHVPGAAETAAELWGVDGAPIVKRLTGGTSWADVTLSDAIATKPQAVVGATLNGKLFLGYDSTVNRLHVYDPNLSSPRVRRVGLRTDGVAPLAANTGSGSYTATQRYYRVRWLQTNYTITDQNTTTNNGDGLRNASSNTRLAQGFQLSAAGTVIALDAIVYKSTGSPVGSAWFTIEADSSGDPSGTPLQTSESVPVAGLDGTGATFVRFTFLRPVTLSASTQYHLVLYGDYTVDASHFASWRGHTSNQYADGVAKRYDGASWGTGTTCVDFAFKIYATGDGSIGPKLYRRSEPTAALNFTPSGSGTGVVVTQPTPPSEQETHWEVEVSTDDATYYQLYGYNNGGAAGDAIPVATTTATDSTATTSYDDGVVSDPIGTYALPPSGQYLISDGNRLLIAGGWESGTPQSRVFFTPVLGSSDHGDDERTPDTATQKNWVDVNENDGGGVTGLGGPLNGVPWYFKFRQLGRLQPTGDVNTPYLPRKVRDDVGCIAHKTIAIGQDQFGRAALYFLSHRGPYRITQDGDIEYLGRDNEVTWRSMNLAATTVVAHSVYHTDLHQWWIWIATGSSNTPDVKMVFDVQLGREDDKNEIRGGWAKHTGLSAAATCSVLFANTLGASMSSDLKPYIGRSSGTTVGKCDTSDTDDFGTDFKAEVTTRPLLNIWDAVKKTALAEPTIIGKAASNSDVTVTATRDFGKESRSASVSLAPAASETRVIKKVEALEIGEADAVQITVGDSAANDEVWTVDAVIVPILRQEDR